MHQPVRAVFYQCKQENESGFCGIIQRTAVRKCQNIGCISGGWEKYEYPTEQANDGIG